MSQLLLLVGEAGLGGEFARVSGDGGGVPRGHAVAQVERAQERAQQRDLEAGELLRPPLELLGPVLGEEELADEVLKDEQDDREQGDGRKPQLFVGEGDPEGEHRRGQLRRHDRDERVPRVCDSRLEPSTYDVYAAIAPKSMTKRRDEQARRRGGSSSRPSRPRPSSSTPAWNAAPVISGNAA